jgi:hypothetical protein
MSAEGPLEEACNQWQELASAENHAIRENDWPRLDACQRAIESLQTRFSDCLEQARSRWARLGPEGTILQSRFRARVGQLIEMERENSALLQHTRSAASAMLKESQQITRRLHRVRQSYNPPQGPGWSSFS